MQSDDRVMRMINELIAARDAEIARVTDQIRKDYAAAIAELERLRNRAALHSFMPIKRDSELFLRQPPPGLPESRHGIGPVLIPPIPFKSPTEVARHFFECRAGETLTILDLIDAVRKAGLSGVRRDTLSTILKRAVADGQLTRERAGTAHEPAIFRVKKE
jgi:hypothetical protein